MDVYLVAAHQWVEDVRHSVVRSVWPLHLRSPLIKVNTALCTVFNIGTEPLAVTFRELEIALEERCVVRIEATGGLALKLYLHGSRGFPDRTVLMRGYNTWFAEFKRLRSGRVSAQQQKWRQTLSKAGFNTYFIDNDEAFERALKSEIII